MRMTCFALMAMAVGFSPGKGTAADFKAGVAVRIITPEGPHWMAGYSSRTKPADTKEHDLFVKVLALEDSAGGKLVLLTSDLIGLPRGLSDAVAEEVRRKTGLSRDRLLLTASHTHCGPVLRDSLSDMYDMPPEHLRKVNAYTDQLRVWMVETIVAALSDLRPARLDFGQGKARFAVNRREPTAKGIINGKNPAGPVDHDVPVLRVRTLEGKLRAVVFGYACHNTTLQYFRWCGDYAGFAQAAIQDKHPGALALFWIGCGADANPLPRSTVELCQKYGRDLATAVEDVLSGPMTSISGQWPARYDRIALPYDALPSKEQLAVDLLSKNFALHQRAARFSQILQQGGRIEDRYAYYPIQVWQLGNGPLWISLGGEVVVDYSLHLKKEYASLGPVWVTGYANDVMAYIPSERVLKEGGYEADSSMIYYGLPSPWAPGIEKEIIDKVHESVEKVRQKP